MIFTQQMRLLSPMETSIGADDTGEFISFYHFIVSYILATGAN